MNVLSKHDYLKKGARSDVHTSIREDLYTDLLVLASQMREPATKIFDVLIEDVFKDKKKLA